MANFFDKILKLFGTKSDRDLKEVNPIVDAINAEFEKLKNISNDDLRAKTQAFRNRVEDFIKAEKEEITSIKEENKRANITVDEKEANYERIDKIEEAITKKIEEILEEILPEAFAVVKETARRFTLNETIDVTASELDKNLATSKNYILINGGKATYKNRWIAAGNEVVWDMIHYNVQLIGGIMLHRGKIAEMATGEGKTLVGTLPMYLNALPGRGIHLVTVNNYLSRRDSEWMAPIFEFHGITVDCIDKYEPHSEERKKAYLADITYGTNNEFGFDYLRDNMTRSPKDLVQRKHNYAIVDEVDSVLIDDARTPLIISGPSPRGDVHEFDLLKPRVERIIKAQRDFVTSALTNAKKLITEGNDKDGGFALLQAYRGLPKNKALIKYLSESGIKAILQKTENYYMQDQNKEMHKVDAELFFVIDEKNNSIELTEKGIELMTNASDTPDFFILPDIATSITKLEKSGLSDDEILAQKDAIINEYSNKSERIHTVNQLLKAYTLFEKDVEYVVMDSKVKIVDEQTGRIMDGRRYSDGLHQAIESKENVKIEASTQTYSTITLQNYFRMYNKLSGMTGTAETEAGELWDIYKLDVAVIPTNRPISRDDKQDLVYKTKREKYNAVIEEINNLVEAGRPVLVGTTSVETSELLGKMLTLRKIKHNVLNAKLHQKEAEIVQEAGMRSGVTIATNMAGRGTDIKLSKEVKELGGLAIIGTERHESRRVDRQLRGRAGRQGDPGSSQFYVSLEDNLMRLFGSDRISGIMDKLGHEEGDVIQHGMISKSIERAQKKVEENNFGIRKRLLEYDDVMNAQREVIYKKRKNALFEERLGVDIANMFYDACESIVAEYQMERNFEGFRLEILMTLTYDIKFDENYFMKTSSGQITEEIFKQVYDKYIEKRKHIAEKSFPIIKSVYENEGSKFENILVPFTDGKKAIQVTANLEKAYNSQCMSIVDAFEGNIMLSIIDDAWKEHLRDMDDLRQSVQNAVYEQKDPLLIYKKESFELFSLMLIKINKEVVSFLTRGNILSQDPGEVRQAREPIRTVSDRRLTASRSADPETQAAANAGREERPVQQPIIAEPKIGRNDPCPCGSGKKFKSCHGA
jgi:preprotein translocase subunit SecA